MRGRRPCRNVLLMFALLAVTRRAMSELPPLGGGAINEKERHYGRMEKDDNNVPSKGTWDPTNNLSHTLHALVGMDRYPNYLVCRCVTSLSSCLCSRVNFASSSHRAHSTTVEVSRQERRRIFRGSARGQVDGR